MPDEINTIPVTTEPAPPAPSEPATTPVAPVEPIPTPPQPAPEPVVPPIITPSASAKASADVPPPPDPLRSLLAKAMAKIQFHKQAKLKKVMVLAKERGQVANDDVQKLLRVSDATATRYLGQLVKTGRLQMIGHPRNASYKPIP